MAPWGPGGARVHQAEQREIPPDPPADPAGGAAREAAVGEPPRSVARASGPVAEPRLPRLFLAVPDFGARLPPRRPGPGLGSRDPLVPRRTAPGGGRGRGTGRDRRAEQRV